MDSPIPSAQNDRRPPHDRGAEASGQHVENSRRAFLKAGLKGALLLPYVAPLIESIRLSDAHANGDDDDDDDNTNTPTKPAPSPIDNVPPPPPSNTNS